MLNWLHIRSLAHHRFSEVWKAGCLILVMLALAPAQAMAQKASCNPDLDFTILTPGPFELGQTLRVSANLGARDIVGGQYMDIYAFGYALNCGQGENFQNCNSQFNEVEVLVQNGIVTDCLNAMGEDAELNFPETNVVPITSLGSPIRVGPNEQCNVQFDMRVNALAGDGNIIRQAMGWPLEGFKATTCSNGLTSTASSTVSFKVNVPLTLVPAIDIVKTASPTTYATDGVNIGYTFVVTNTGNVTLTAVTVTDPLPNLSAIACNWAGSSDGATPAGTLSPAETVSCTAAYTTTTADVTAGKVDNTATVRGTPPTGANVNDTDSETITSTAAPGIDVRKEIWNGTAFVDANSAASAPVKTWPAGAIYRIIVKNTGAVPLYDVVINDAALGVSNYAPVGSGGAGTLAVNEEVIITSAQVLALDQQSRCTSSGDYENIASASGKSVATDSQVSDTDSAWLKCVGTPNMAVKKEISIDSGDTWIDGTAGPVEFPHGALYRITVENTGSVKLVNVTVSDTLIGPPNHVIGDLAIGETVVVADGVIEVGDSDWAALDVAEVCDSSGLIENIASVTGTSDELASDEVTKTDNAKLDCIGPPMIAVKKEISLDNGANWHDANDAPFPTAVTNPLSPVTALYRITVTNIGDVALTGVLVNDTTLGIVDYAPIGVGGSGVLAVGESVEIDSGDLPVLTVQDRCATAGEKANVAGAEGYSAAGTKDEATDSATVECIGAPAIRITKEVSSDGVNFEDVTTSAVAPSDAWYRITVENIGAVDLENVVISDAILGLTDVVVTGAAGAGLLAVGEVVVISHSGGGGDNELAELYVPELCFEADSYINTAIADGKSVESVQTVDDSDAATFVCEERVDICEIGRPTRLKLMYDGDDDSDNEQGASFTANPQSVNFPATPITIKTFNSQDLTTPLNTFQNMSVGGLFYVEDPSKSGKIPPNIVIQFWNGDTLLQTIAFHGSCSAPLNIGDEYSAATIVGVIF